MCMRRQRSSHRFHMRPILQACPCALSWARMLMGLLLLAAIVPVTPAPSGASEIRSFAFVEPDGSMRMAGNVIRLHGIYIPPTGESCHMFERPPRCGPRAALALEFKVSGVFVHCQPLMRHPDDSIVAICTADGDDLGAWMLERGWAVATPNAPFEYTTLERIARANGIGVWGIPVEPVRR
jgi:hypothetical protein